MVQKLLRRIENFPDQLYTEHETFAKDAAGIAYVGTYRDNSLQTHYSLRIIAGVETVGTLVLSAEWLINTSLILVPQYHGLVPRGYGDASISAY